MDFLETVRKLRVETETHLFGIDRHPEGAKVRIWSLSPKVLEESELFPSIERALDYLNLWVEDNNDERKTKEVDLGGPPVGGLREG